VEKRIAMSKVRKPDAPINTPLDRRTIVEQIVESLREGILRGRYEHGDELNQAELAKEFGVARIPVREALRQLQGEGLVRSTAHMRVIVNGITPEVAIEQIEVRAVVEHYLLGRAAAKLTQDDFAELSRLCDLMENETDRFRWLQLNEQFHRTLLDPAKSTFAIDFTRQLASLVGKYLESRSPLGLGNDKIVNAQHRRIVAALNEGRVDEARAELLAHIHNTRDRVAAFVAKQTDQERSA
jgi:DNA-binding GntR family transcriptional regulator